MNLKRTFAALSAAALCVALAPAAAFAGEHQPDPLDHAALAAQQAQEAGAALTDMAADAAAWSLTSSGYIAEDLETIIPGALAKGVDVSSWQGRIDWEAVKADGVTFAIIRIGYGGDYEDQDDAYFEYNASECERLGIPYGVYLYSYAYDTSMALSEAEHVLRLLDGRSLAYPVYYDLEQTYDGRPGGVSDGVTHTMDNDELAQVAGMFCQRIAAEGYTPAIYASLWWWNSFLTDSMFKNLEHWVAQYANSCSYAGDYRVWQAASDAHVNGVSGNVDVDFDYVPQRAAGYARGDLNLNGRVNVVDAQIAYDLATNSKSSYWTKLQKKGVAWNRKTVKYFADVNEDYHLDAADARAIQSAMLRGAW